MRTSRKRVWVALAASGVMAATGPVASAAIEVAENLLVNLDASGLSQGPLTSWQNAGTLGGFFVNDPIATFSNVNAGPVGGINRGVIFTGNDAMVSRVDPNDPFSFLDAPPGVVGVDPTRSIEVWAYNPGIAGEEAMISWGKRGQAGGPGGPDATGSAMQFNYGSSGAFGAATHWGAPDIGWGQGGPPARGVWHHLTYTFEGAGGAAGSTPTTRVYIDGVQANQEVLAPGVINTWTPYQFRLGAALAGNEANLEIWASLALAKVRVHDGVLTPAQIVNNYNEEKGAFVTQPPQPPTARPITRGPRNRYSFDGTGGDGAVLTDSIGGQHGVLRTLDTTSSLNGSGQMSLAGGASATAGYGDLPNGLISSLTELTLEAWVTPQGAQNWMRIADFGNTTEEANNGEHMGPGGAGAGEDYIFMSATRGTNLNNKRAEMRDAPATGGAILSTADATVATTAGVEQHYAVVYSATSELGAPELRFYVNGNLVASTNTEIRLSDIQDLNNWLGRSNYTVDSNFQGLFNEFRIYEYALSSDEILGNFQAGATRINIASLWAVDAGGNWSTLTNWTGNVPNAPSANAWLGSVITGDRQVNLDVPVTLGSIRLDDDNRYEVAGPSTLSMEISHPPDASGGTALITAAGSGSHIISAPLMLVDDTDVSVIQPAATLTLSNLAPTQQRIRKIGPGTVNVNRVRAAALDVNAGTVRIIQGGGEAGVSNVGGLTIAGADNAWTATLDLADNDLIVRSDAAGKEALLRRIMNQVKSARDPATGDRWSGRGITSSAAAADALTGLAVVPNFGLTTYAGQAVGPDDVITKYTYNGDANIDGIIDADDYFRIDSGFLTPPAAPTYRDGDFNYDGLIDADDYFLIDSAFLGQGAPMASGSLAAIPIPEPAAGAAFLLLAMGGLARRRSRR